MPDTNRLVRWGLNIFAAIVIFSVTQLFLEQQLHREEIGIAFLITAVIFGGLYAGRFMSYLWLNKTEKALNRAILVIPFIILIAGFFALVTAVSVIKSNNPQLLVLDAPLLFIFSAACGMLIKMIREKVKLQLNAANITATHSQTELHLLQSQLSPHFLFNTLNNMYGISLSQHEKIPALLLKLSELLRYSVYDAKESYVLLKDEILYLENYIEFEKIRIGEKLNLTVEIDDIKSSNLKIAPMLLIVFLENAFKHSKNTLQSKIHIYIGLKIWAGSILFSVKNSYNTSARSAENFQGSSGLGLANVRKRLELLYANGYDLKIEDETDFYTVMLRVNAK